MDVQCRSRRFAAEFSQFKNEMFLQFVGKMILSAEENDAALRDWISLLQLRER